MSEMRKLEDPVRTRRNRGRRQHRLPTGVGAGVDEPGQSDRAQQGSAPGRSPRRLSKSIVSARRCGGRGIIARGEHRQRSDVFVALTNSEEANILSAMVAKKLGCKKVMALITRPSYADLVEVGRDRRRHLAAADHHRIVAASMCASEMSLRSIRCAAVGRRRSRRSHTAPRKIRKRGRSRRLRTSSCRPVRSIAVIIRPTAIESWRRITILSSKPTTT